MTTETCQDCGASVDVTDDRDRLGRRWWFGQCAACAVRLYVFDPEPEPQPDLFAGDNR